jgi:hypothetical protein
MGEIRNTSKNFVGNPDGKRRFVRSRHRWDNNIKIDLGEVGLLSVVWIHLAHYRDK